MNRRSIEQVLAEHSGHLMAIPGVAVVYEGRTPDGDPCIVVGVENRTSELERTLPDSLDTYPVLIQETGKIEPR
jgi:hypothetical protein